MSAQRGPPSPQRCQSLSLARKTSPKANPKVVKAEVEGTPRRPDSVPRARAGSQRIQARHPLARLVPQSSFSTRSPKPQDGDTLCHRPEIPVSDRLAHFLTFW